MKAWESIVVGIDFSDSSISALREAARLAHWQGCNLHVAHVIAADKDYSEHSESSTAISIVRDKIEQRLKDLCSNEIDYFGDVEYHILVGHPFRELCQLSHDLYPDLLVLGSRGITAKPNHTGAIASKCVRKAPVPVLLVRKGHENPYANILVPMDFSNTAKSAAKIAAEIAFENQSHLHLVHVYEPLLRSADYAFFNFLTCTEITSAEKERIESLLQDIQDDIQKSYPDLPITAHLIEKGHVAKSLKSFINGHDVKLTVLGTNGRTGLRSILLGTTAEHLLQASPCSILAVKPDDFTYPL